MNENSPIFHMQENKANIIREVSERSVKKLLESNSAEHVLNEAAYKELLRLNKKHPKVDFWQNIYRSLNKTSPEKQQQLLLELSTEYVEDIIGRFDPRVYRFATSMVPHILGLLLDPQLSLKKRNTFQEKVMIEGHVETARKLSDKGTIILVPTHSSNMDSMVAGFSAFCSGLPPVTYGAGKNLFTNPILSFFMHNLGAYRLDRRLKHEAYKTALKTYSLVILERGFHSLFFPGGTRSRSGRIEQKLKLGLMGTGIEAYVNNLINNKPKPNIYLVPMTINYYVTLEAETLIDDYLKEQGQSRYIIEDDESSKFTKTFSYLKKTLDLDGSMFIRYGPPLDIFGNRVDDEGISYDDQGRVVDPSRYVKNWQGEVTRDDNRDREYTREAGERVAQSYLQNNVILSPHMVSYVLFGHLVHNNPHLDLYQLIRVGGRDSRIQRELLIETLDRFKKFLTEEEQKGTLRLATALHHKPAEQILREALHYLQMFYSKEVVVADGDTLKIQDVRLLYYYHNRLSGYDFENRFMKEILKPVLGEQSLTHSR